MTWPAPTRVYVVVTDDAGAVVARRYLDADEVPSWLAVKAVGHGVRCDVYDEAPVCGGKRLTTFVPREHGWREQTPVTTG
jgi:hypothetical protein